MSVSNIILLLDLASAAVETATKINTTIAKANLEGRDVSDEELKAIASTNDALMDRLRAEQ